jgi:hypothetical protein
VASDPLSRKTFMSCSIMTAKKCVTMKTDPKDQKKFKMLGKYPTLGEAETAMLTMTECK